MRMEKREDGMFRSLKIFPRDTGFGAQSNSGRSFPVLYLFHPEREVKKFSTAG